MFFRQFWFKSPKVALSYGAQYLLKSLKAIKLNQQWSENHYNYFSVSFFSLEYNISSLRKKNVVLAVKLNLANQ